MADRCAPYPEGADEVDRAYIDSIVGIPDGSFVQGVISVLSWVDPEGRNQWRVTYAFDQPISQGIGLLHMATVEMMARTPGTVTGLGAEPE